MNDVGVVKAILTIDPLLMNAFNGVNLGGAVVITTATKAKALGIPESKWVYIYGAAGTQDSGNSEYHVILLHIHVDVFIQQYN